MYVLWYNKPYKLFFLMGIITTLMALTYLVFMPDSEFVLSIYGYFVVSSFTLWLVFSTYLYMLSAIYFSASRIKLKTRSWFVVLHYLFILFFTVCLFSFSMIKSTYPQHLFSNASLTLLISL